MSAPVVVINGEHVSEQIASKSLTVRLNAIDFTLLDPENLPMLGDDVELEAPYWFGLVVSVTVTDNDYPGSTWVKVTATNEELTFGGSSWVLVDTTHDYRKLAITRSLQDGAEELRGTLETIEAPTQDEGPTVGLTSATHGLNAQYYSITELTISWLTDDQPLYRISFGESVVTLPEALITAAAGTADAELIIGTPAAGKLTLNQYYMLLTAGGDAWDMMELDTEALNFGSGDATTDVHIYRSAANTLKLDTDGLGGALTKLSVPGALEVHGGTSFPASPATNDMFYRTDYGMWFYYDGADWRSSPAFIGCRSYKAAAQTVSAATETTMLFDTDEYDDSALHNTGANTGRFTVPVGYGGKWRFTLHHWATGNQGASYLYLRKNGTTAITGTELDWTTTTDYGTVLAATLKLVETDYVEVRAYRTTGTTIGGAGAIAETVDFHLLALAEI